MNFPIQAFCIWDESRVLAIFVTSNPGYSPSRTIDLTSEMPSWTWSGDESWLQNRKMFDAEEWL